MALLQVQIDEKLKKAMHGKARSYGVPMSSLVKIVLVHSFMPQKEFQAGNIFNAQRDNQGKGIPLDDLLKAL